MSIDCSFIGEGNVTIIAFKSADAATAAATTTPTATATAVTSIVIAEHNNIHSFHHVIPIFIFQFIYI
jgi:hypothetical protein